MSNSEEPKYGQELHSAFLEAREGKDKDGNALPSFAELDETDREAWDAAGNKLLERLPELKANKESELEEKVKTDPVAETKFLRREIARIGERMHTGTGRRSRSRSLAETKLEEASMWLGKDLNEQFEGRNNAENPYPNSMNPENGKIDPPAPDAFPAKTASQRKKQEKERRQQEAAAAAAQATAATE